MIEAPGFATEYGEHLLAQGASSLGRWVAVVHPEPWALLEPDLGVSPVAVITAGDLSREHLEDLVAAVPAADHVVGIGGGSAMDTAKWLHWRTGTPLVQVPSLPSVDACFTRMTALRHAGGVRYEGDSVPKVVLVDHWLIRQAPPALISGGIGDVLSCHTARFDWQLAAAAGLDHPWDEEAAAASCAYVDELEALAPLLAIADPEGIRRLMECHRDIGWRCHALGHARFEEGSEHFFAYAFEAVTGRTIMHGDLVTLGVLVMSALQDNDPARPRRIASIAGARTALHDLGITWGEVETTLRHLRAFVEEQQLWYSVIHELEIGDGELRMVRAALGG